MKKHKILIIEDDQLFANIYRNKLVLDGFQVELVYDGQAGVEMVDTYRPDAILIDLMLPKLPGVEVIKQIRAQPAFEKLPLIVFSNTFLTTMVQDAWKAGATKCLAKANCTPKQVIATLLGLLDPINTTETSAPAEETVDAKPPGPDADDEFQGELRKSFMDTWPATMANLRAQLKILIKSDDEAVRLKQLEQLYRQVHVLTGSANIVGMLKVAQLTDALEALLKELQDKPKNINASTLRTVASGVDFLDMLCSQSSDQIRQPVPAKVLVVDDEVISRRAVVYALDKVKLKSVAVEDPLKAYDLLSTSRFDLVFLDVDMPNMSGFELCSKLRTLSAYKKTPVVFITSLNDFENRANSSMSGGNDFIAKPFMFIELAVKALIYVLRTQVQPVKK
jgi:DNA-binding response OmpR family regulator